MIDSPRIFAHRGRLPGFRENTLDAFVECARRGADGVELDVRRTADGAIVVHHDPSIGGAGTIAEVAVRDLPPWVPLLSEVLDACEDITVNVELKNDPDEPGFDGSGSLAAAVGAELAGREERVMISCFHLPSLDQVHAEVPDIPSAWLTVPVDTASLQDVARRGHAGVNPLHRSLTEELVAEAHALGLAVNAWTVDEPERMAELAAWGVDILFTNELEKALAALTG